MSERLTVFGSKALPCSQVNDHVTHSRLSETVILTFLRIDADHMLCDSLQRLAAAQQVLCYLHDIMYVIEV